MISLRQLWRWVTIAHWIRHYRLADAGHDALAGLTVGVTVVPQGMAYAVLAGLPAVYGLYASLVPLLVYPVFATARSVAFGIVAIDMLIAGAAITRLGALTPEEAGAVAILLAAVAGALHLVMGVLRLGWVVAYLSRPVVTGFLLAAPILIAAGQVGNLLGIGWPRAAELVGYLQADLPDPGVLSWVPVTLGVCSVFLMVGLRIIHRDIPAALVVVVGSTLVVELMGFRADVGRVGPITAGLPPFGLVVVDFETARGLLGTAVTLVLVQLVTVVSLGRALAREGQDGPSPNKELIALGAANFVGAFFASPPVSASLSRSTVNADAGARTPLANAFAALVVLGVLTFGAELVAKVPLPALAAIIVVSAAGLITLDDVRELFSIRWAEGALAVAVAVLTLVLGIQEGVLIGVAASLLAMLYFASRPRIVELGRVDGTGELRDLEGHPDAQRMRGALALRVDGSLSFTNSEYVRRQVLLQLDLARRPVYALILDGRGVNLIDATAARSLQTLADELEERGLTLYLTSFKRRARRTLKRAGLLARAANDGIELPASHLPFDRADARGAKLPKR